jgi:predicted pyridoxine 5'-phosphate oxidase superfamily flavin-nucleotide-binding protein
MPRPASDRAAIETEIVRVRSLGPANAEGQPYIQHRGGPPGFLKMLDDKTSALPISPAIGNTSRRAISWTTPRRIFFDRLYTAETHLNYVSQCP